MRLSILTILSVMFSGVSLAQSNPYPQLDPLYGTCWRNDHIRICPVPRPIPQVLMVIEDSLSGPFYSPVCQTKVISRYGSRGRSNHSGTDLKQTATDTIYATQNGVVRMACVYSGYGKLILIRHPNGLETVYSHMKTLWVKANDTILGNQAIGIAGRTGRATTEHLHFEFRFLYNTFNAELVYDFENQLLKQDTLFFKAGVLQRKAKGTSDEPTLAESDQKVISGTIVHVIEKGETLYSLARHYGVSVATLCRENGINDPSKIRVGQRLTITSSQPDSSQSKFDDVI